MQSLLYKKVQDSQVRSNLANELMIYHMQVRNAVARSLRNYIHKQLNIRYKYKMLLYASYVIKMQLVAKEPCYCKGNKIYLKNFVITVIINWNRTNNCTKRLNFLFVGYTRRCTVTCYVRGSPNSHIWCFV